MKMKVRRTMSTFFQIGDIVDMQITSKRGDFTIEASGYKQSFGYAYYRNLTKQIKGELESNMIIEEIEPSN